ncbi:hypothetical protein J6590_079481 [Homalodisca vitripennis]|nr:hypothetical protein J6590_079481 [Homalodisca vitripennis]
MSFVENRHKLKATRNVEGRTVILRDLKFARDYVKRRRAWLLLGWMIAVQASSPPTRPLAVVRNSPLRLWSPGQVLQRAS